MSNAIPLTHILIVSSILFVLGIAIIIIKRNAIVILIGIEFLFNAANLNFIAFSQYDPELKGQLTALFSIVISAAESAIFLAIIVRVYREYKTIQIDQLYER